MQWGDFDWWYRLVSLNISYTAFVKCDAPAVDSKPSKSTCLIPVFGLFARWVGDPDTLLFRTVSNNTSCRCFLQQFRLMKLVRGGWVHERWRSACVKPQNV